MTLPSPGKVIATVDKGQLTLAANTELDTSGFVFEADLARAVRGASGIVECQFASTHALDKQLVTHVLSVKIEPALLAAAVDSAEWTRLREACTDIAQPADGDPWGGLAVAGSKSLSMRALYMRITRVGRHGVMMFSTLSGGDISKLGTRFQGTLEMNLQPVVEVNMDATTLGVMLDSIERVDQAFA